LALPKDGRSRPAASTTEVVTASLAQTGRRDQAQRREVRRSGGFAPNRHTRQCEVPRGSVEAALPEIVIRDLHYAYPPVVPDGEPVSVLRGIDLEIEKGEFVSLMGPTGVGKTTLCLALNGIVPRSMGGTFKGDVLVSGLNTREHPVPTLASKAGVVFQDPESQFFNMTVEDEVAFGPESLGIPRVDIAERIRWALSVVQMSEYRDRSPFQLSGGQKQRVAIAAILAMKPGIIVLDEPTSGLDPMGKSEVFSVVRELKQRDDIMVLMVEQEAERIAEFSDRVIVMDDGKIAMTGTPSEVFCQVERMHDIGLAVPQVSELGRGLSDATRTFNFTRFDEAYAALTSPAVMEAFGKGPDG